MTFSGEFKQAAPSQSDDLNREQEFIKHHRKNGYKHIINNFLKEQYSSEGIK